MGISSFSAIEDYVLFVLLLMFLEEKLKGEQFILSNLLDYIKVNIKTIDDGKITIDFTRFADRKSLVRVLKYASKMHLITAYDGIEDNFSQNASSEVLYEVTGISRYFMRNFNTDISLCNNYLDILKNEEIGLGVAPNVLKRNNVYREILTEPVIYNSSIVNNTTNLTNLNYTNSINNIDSSTSINTINASRDFKDKDFDYIKTYKNVLIKDIEKNLSSRFYVYRNMAYMLLNTSVSFTDVHPNTKAVSDIALLFSSYLLQLIKENVYIRKYLNSDLKEENTKLTDTSSKKNIDKSENKISNSHIISLDFASLFEFNTVNDTLTLSYSKFCELLLDFKHKLGRGFSIEYKYFEDEVFIYNVISYMKEFKMLEVIPNNNTTTGTNINANINADTDTTISNITNITNSNATLVILPIVFTLVGKYPDDFTNTVFEKEGENMRYDE